MLSVHVGLQVDLLFARIGTELAGVFGQNTALIVDVLVQTGSVLVAFAAGDADER